MQVESQPKPFFPSGTIAFFIALLIFFVDVWLFMFFILVGREP